MSETPWIKFNFHENMLTCERCAEQYCMPDEPTEIHEWLAKINGFIRWHRACKKTNAKTKNHKG